MTTYDKKRIIAGILGVFVVAAAVNWHFELVFPQFARAILALTVLMVGVFALRFAPTRRDFEEHTRGHADGGS
jgi:hypothetical protein